MIDVYFSYRKKYLEIASQIGYKLGTRADQYNSNGIEKLSDEYSIDFVDNNFKDPDRERLYTVARKVDAEYVVLPDISNTNDVDNIISFGNGLQSKGFTPIIVPKVQFDFSKIPDDWLLGFSVPSGYGNTDISITEFDSGHGVHLLGGSPKKQIQCATEGVKSGVDIVSVDGNAFAKASGYGNIINEPSEILDGGNAWDAGVDYPDDWGGRLIVSLVRNFLLWRDWSNEYLD